MGFKTISFDVVLASDSDYLGIYVKSAENYLTSDSEVVVAENWAGKTHFVSNGARVTLDLQATLEAMTANDALLKFFVAGSTSLAGASAMSFTLSNFVFA